MVTDRLTGQEGGGGRHVTAQYRSLIGGPHCVITSHDGVGSTVAVGVRVGVGRGSTVAVGVLVASSCSDRPAPQANSQAASTIMDRVTRARIICHQRSLMGTE